MIRREQHRGNGPRLVLASASPRRRDLLRQAGYRFDVRPAEGVDEDAVPRTMQPDEYVETLASMKVRAAAAEHDLDDGLVLGADTTVEADGRLVGKPVDPDDARRILWELSRTAHRVLTGLALLDLGRDRELARHESTRIRMRPMTAEEIDAYVAGGEAMGKAGAYALQETGDRFVEEIDGSFTNVVGLPMRLLERMLREAGYAPEVFREV